MWIWLALLVLVVLLVVAVVVVLAVRGRTQARDAQQSAALDQPDADRPTPVPSLVYELRPSFTASMTRLRKGVRGINFRYGVPWYLLIGPGDSGKSTLVAQAPQSSALEPHSALEGRAASGIDWHYFDGGVVIDVSASLAMPGTRHDMTGWRALLFLLKRHRPRRPVEGVIVAVPAPLLLDSSWKARTHDLGAAIRDRLVLAQAELGFAVPVYIVITQADHISGFSAFTDALTDNLQQNMFGWSNPHAVDGSFDGEWIEQAFDELHRGVVHLQVELFAASEHLERVSDLFLFSGELQRVAAPLRGLLEEIFRPSVYRSASLFRGFYFSGRGPARAAEPGTLDIREAPLPISFVGDLLDRKIFPERGVAMPLPHSSIATNRVSLAAQTAAVLLAVILTAGTLWAGANLQRVQQAHEAFLDDVRAAYDSRILNASQGRNSPTDDRIMRAYGLLQTMARLSSASFHSIFIPTSLMRPLEPRVGDILRATFGDLVLPDFRDGLEQKGRVVFAWNPAASEHDDEELVKPLLAESPHYRALEQFAADYRQYMDNYFRYTTLSAHESGDLNQLAALGNYVTGHTTLQRIDVPEEPYGSALRSATSHPIDCGPLAGLVATRAREALAEFGTSWFGDRNPVRASGQQFVHRWSALVADGDADINELADGLKVLSQAVSTWTAIGARSGELSMPVLEQPPFRPVTRGVCDELKPDLSDDIRHVAAQRDDLTPTLLGLATEPFGPLLDRGEKGLELSQPVRQLKAAFDDLATHDFRTALPVNDGDTTLPRRATWRTEAVDHATALFESFDRYRSGSFAQLAPAYRRPLVTAVEVDVASALAAHLAFDATEGEPLPSEPAAFAAELGRLGTRLGKMSRVLPFLEQGDEPFARALERELDEQAGEALQRVEREATARHPFVFGRQSEPLFAAWADVAAGGAAPADVLKRWTGYIDEQHESLRRYVAQAEPLVRFLVATHGQNQLARRWSGLLDDVTTFDQKMAGNGLAALDTFLREGLPIIVPDRECGAGAGLAPLRASGSFLIGLRNDLLEDAVKRCRELLRVGVQSRYTAIAQSFNTLLAGRFPFTQGLDASRDAAPADVTEFLRVYDRQDGRSLAAQIASRACSEDAARFLRRIDALYPVFAPARELQGNAVALDVVPEFRVNRDRDVGGNEIAQWTMDVGRQSFRDGEAAKPARWISGDPVHLSFRFAKDSPARPAADATASRRIADRTVRLDFTGPWALLALLRSGRSVTDLVASTDATPNTLRFDIPVERDPERRPVVGASQAPTPGPFRVFIRVRLFQPGKQDPIAVDEFPAQAPATVACSAT
jgi:type VI secretion system protein ImpL